MRPILLASIFGVAFAASGSTRAADPAAGSTEPPSTTTDPSGPATVQPPTAADPKLPNAGRPIKLAVPQKNEGSSLLWKPRWHKFSSAEYVVTGASIAITIGSLLIPPRPTAWNSGGILFDEGARSTLRPKSEGWRLNMRDTSDVLLSISSTYPFLVDALAVAYWHRGSAIVATQMALMNAEAMAVTAAVQGLVSSLVSRERPYAASGEECVTNPENEDCVRSNRYRSFFSGHTSQAFVSAAITCAHHANIPLYGGSADTVACISHVALATTVGMLRVVSDVHYVSDVITGAVVGSLVGLSIPYLFHYRGSSEGTAAKKSAWPAVSVVPMPTGLAVTGIFG